MKKELNPAKVAERKKLVEFVAESKKKSTAEVPSKTGYCRVIYFRHSNYEEEDYTYGFK